MASDTSLVSGQRGEIGDEEGDDIVDILNLDNNAEEDHDQWEDYTTPTSWESFVRHLENALQKWEVRISSYEGHDYAI